MSVANLRQSQFYIKKKLRLWETELMALGLVGSWARDEVRIIHGLRLPFQTVQQLCH